jgi:hypothetical protein
MPELCRFYGIVIRMYYQDHSPAHFHAEYQGYEAVIGIETLAVLDGELPNTARQLVTEWAALHQQELFTAWSNAQKPSPIGSIAPLE